MKYLISYDLSSNCALMLPLFDEPQVGKSRIKLLFRLLVFALIVAVIMVLHYNTTADTIPQVPTTNYSALLKRPRG